MVFILQQIQVLISCIPMIHLRLFQIPFPFQFCNNSDPAFCNFEDFSSPSSFNALTACNPELIHCRMGHLPFHQIQFIDPSVCGSYESKLICQVSPQAKQHRNSFPLKSFKSDYPFQLVYIDTWVPISTLFIMDSDIF